VGGLVGTVGTNRLYALDGAFGLGLRNLGDEPTVVRQVQLDSPLFEAMPPAAEEVLLQPGGRRFVLPVPYGQARCDNDADETFAAVVVVDDGEELRLPLIEEYPGAVVRLHAHACAAEEVRELVDLRLGDQWTRDGDAVSGELVLEQRRPGPDVAVDGARGSVIFTVQFEGDPPIVRVTDDEPRATAPVVISVALCSSHALAESKRTYQFLTWVTVGDAEPIPVELAPTGAALAALEELFATCHPLS
jgi:hypothetical protein